MCFFLMGVAKNSQRVGENLFSHATSVAYVRKL